MLTAQPARSLVNFRDQEWSDSLIAHNIYDGIGQFRSLISLGGSGGRAHPEFSELERIVLNRAAVVSGVAVMERILALAVRTTTVWLLPGRPVPARWTASAIVGQVPPAAKSQAELRRIARETTATPDRPIAERLGEDLYHAGSHWYAGRQVSSAAEVEELRHAWAHGRDQLLVPVTDGTVAVLLSAVERGFSHMAWTLTGQWIAAACPEWAVLRTAARSGP